ncbi:MAG TPA: hypothetical protein VKA82_04505, partial [Rubrobacter sp.]|nr:hypothetical protein [Rubrobacter sp.]
MANRQQILEQFAQNFGLVPDYSRDQLADHAEPGRASVSPKVAADLRWLRARARVGGVGQSHCPCHTPDETATCKGTAQCPGVAKRRRDPDAVFSG